MLKRTLLVVNMAKAISMMVNKLKHTVMKIALRNKVVNTPTFVSGKLTIDKFRWAGVPFFYIRTGKRMKFKTIQVVVEFKEVPMNL